MGRHVFGRGSVYCRHFGGKSTWECRRHVCCGGYPLHPAFVRYAPWQIADVPLSFFIVGSLVLMARATLDQPQTHGWWFVAGVSSGLAAWTKNEGLLFVLVLVGLVVGATICRRPIVPMKSIGALLLGMSPAFLALAALKFWWAPPNSITNAQSLAYITNRLVDLDRLQVISTAIVANGGTAVVPLSAPSLSLPHMRYCEDRAAMVYTARMAGNRRKYLRDRWLYAGLSTYTTRFAMASRYVTRTRQHTLSTADRLEHYGNCALALPSGRHF